MKKRNLLPGFALAALLALGLTGTAHAGEQQPEDYTCNEGGHPPPASSNYDITIYAPDGPGPYSCTLGSIQAASIGLLGFSTITTGNLTATEDRVSIWSSSHVTTGDITAATHVLISEGADQVGSVTSGTSGTGILQIYGNDGLETGDLVNTGGDILVGSAGSVSIASTNNTYGGIMIRAAGLIDVAGGITNKNGDVRIFGNYEQTSGDPLVIGSGGIGYIHNNGDYGYGIYISSPTGISYDGTDLLQTHADSGTPGYVYLDGGSSGTVTLAGSIVVDKSDGAGSIAIFAPEIVTNGATLSASASAGSPAGYINLITAQITKTGALTINNNGDGSSTAEVHLAITPADSWSVYPNQTNPDFFLETGPFQASSQPLSVTGSGLLTVTANGDNHAIQIYGYPLTLSSATITQHGTGDALYVQSTDYVNNVDDVLTLGGTIELHENTIDPDGPTNVMSIRGTSLATLSGHVLLDTSGKDGSPGGDLTLPFFTGNLVLGQTGSTLELITDGSSTGGKPGNINIGDYGDLTVSVFSGDAVTASAHSGSPAGGKVIIIADSFTSDGENPGGTFKLNGSGFGRGGSLTVTTTGSTIATDISNGFSVEARGGDNGDGGSVEINSVTDITVGGGIDVSPGTEADPGLDGGSIKLSSQGALSVLGNLTADGEAEGTGGIIELTGAEVEISSGVVISASDFHGGGGQVKVTTTDPYHSLVLTNVAINANGVQTNPDPAKTNIQIHAAGEVSMDFDSVISAYCECVHAGGISVTFGESAYDKTANLNGAFFAPGSSHGGDITISAETGGNIEGAALLLVPALNETGTGGNITLDTGNGGNYGINMTGSFTADENNAVKGQVKLNATADIVKTGILTGIIEAVGASVTLTNSTPTPVPYNIKTLTAFDGDVTVTNDHGSINVLASGASAPAISAVDDVNLTGADLTLALGADAGQDYIEGENVTVTATGSDGADITLGSDILSDGNITISSSGDGGSVLSTGGGIKPALDGADNYLEITITGPGSIGDPGTPLQTGVAGLKVTTDEGSTSIENTTSYGDGLTLDTISVGGDLKLSSNSGIVTNDVLSTAGNIDIRADTGGLIVSVGSHIEALEGGINLSTLGTSANEFVNLQGFAYVLADSGFVSIFRGANPPAEIAGTDPGNNNFNAHHDGKLFWGNPSVTTAGDTAPSTLCADGSTIRFQASGDATKIMIDTNYIRAEIGNHGCPR